jgi:preprotein translocase subunit YajC
MLHNLTGAAALFADAAGGATDAAKGAAGQQGDLFQMLMPIALILLVFYFFMIRPQKKEQSKRQEMLSNVKKNDRVLIAGGIYGTVMSVQRDQDEVTVKVDETTNTKLRVTVSAIVRVLGEGDSSSESAKS